MSQLQSAATSVPTPPPLPPCLRYTRWDDRQNTHITLYTDGDSNKHAGMAGRTVVCQISVIRNQRVAHFSPISHDGNFPMRIISQKSHDNHTIFSNASDALDVLSTSHSHMSIMLVKEINVIGWLVLLQRRPGANSVQHADG